MIGDQKAAVPGGRHPGGKVDPGCRRAAAIAGKPGPAVARDGGDRACDRRGRRNAGGDERQGRRQREPDDARSHPGTARLVVS